MSFIIILLCIFSMVAARDLSVGFMIYGNRIPEEALYAFDWLVVDPDSEHTKDIMNRFYLKNRKAKLIAYVSVGEAEPYRWYFRDVKKEWILGENRVWKTKVIDLRDDGYLKLLLDKILPGLKDFDGFFLDTLDSHQMFLKDSGDRKKVEDNLVEFIKAVRRIYPDKLILINRGFEFIDRVYNNVDALVAEGLFYGLSLGEKIDYRKMGREEAEWLLQRLNHIKSLGLRVVVIDYVDPINKKLQMDVAKKIMDAGFIPYVSDKYLRTLGVGIYRIQPRKVLLIYDERLYADPSHSVVNRLIQPWLEYLGLVPIVMDVRSVLYDERLDYFMADEYAGIVVDLEVHPEGTKLHRWLVKKKEEGIKIFFLNGFGFPPEDSKLRDFGIRKTGDIKPGDDLKLEKSTLPFFESKPHLEDTIMLDVKKPRHYLLMSTKGRGFYPMAITEWGGFALSGSLLVSGVENFSLFVYDPVEFFKHVFETLPVIPDATTENGRRVLTVHIDGDAFFGNTDFDPSRNIGEVIRDEIIKRYSVPHTVSIIEGEIAPHGLYPEKSQWLEAVARSIFRLENVELASHTFSHPFNWQLLKKLATENIPISAELNYNLPIPGYKFDLRREVFGSIEYINNRLAPSGKRVKVFLWSGDTNPSPEAIRLTYEAGVYNVNGGYSWISERAGQNLYMFISPMGINKGSYFQIYAPIMNESIYTDLWTDYGGYIRVIQTFELTERPYRIKPIGVYYHMYSGQKVASLNSLKRVYEYVLKQEVNPMFLSEFAQRVLEFRNMVIAEDVRDGSTVIRGGGNLRTLRVEGSLPDINLDKSTGVVGFREVNRRLYIHLDASGDYRIHRGNGRNRFYLVSANGQVISFYRGVQSYSLRLDSYMPHVLEFYSDGCDIKFIPEPQDRKLSEKTLKVTYSRKGVVDVEALCKE